MGGWGKARGAAYAHVRGAGGRAYGRYGEAAAVQGSVRRGSLLQSRMPVSLHGTVSTRDK